jgi:UDP-N-acetylmuramoyl-tripeptide--D-alanyl-D-alanine ligase
MKIEVEDLKKLTRCRILGDSKSGRISFAGASIDSRTCRKSDLFFAVKGQKNDGHEFVKEVFGKGIKGAVVSKKWFRKLPEKDKKFFLKYLLVAVDDTVKSLGELASVHRSKFLLPVLAVGGSNGKTTAKEFIAHVLSKKYNVLKTKGNYNNEFGVPLTLFRLNEKHDIAVIEVGANHFGEIACLCRIAKPQFGIITNIGKEHLEFFGTLRGAAKAECELIDYLNANFGTFFLNKDDKFLTEKVSRTGIKHVSFGKSGKPDVKGKLKFFDRFNPVIKISSGNKRFTAKLKPIGSQSFEAALCASAVGFYFGVALSQIKKALEEIELGKSKRNNLIRTANVWVIDDTYNSNPDSVRIALENLKRFKVMGKKHIVLADMLELGRVSRKEHTESGKLIKKLGFENLYTYGNEAYNIFKGAKGVKNNYYFTEKRTLAEFLDLNLKKDDIILVKGSRAMKMEEIVQSIN